MLSNTWQRDTQKSYAAPIFIFLAASKNVIWSLVSWEHLWLTSSQYNSRSTCFKTSSNHFKLLPITCAANSQLHGPVLSVVSTTARYDAVSALDSNSELISLPFRINVSKYCRSKCHLISRFHYSLEKYSNFYQLNGAKLAGGAVHIWSCLSFIWKSIQTSPGISWDEGKAKKGS